MRPSLVKEQECPIDLLVAARRGVIARKVPGAGVLAKHPNQILHWLEDNLQWDVESRRSNKFSNFSRDLSLCERCIERPHEVGLKEGVGSLGAFAQVIGLVYELGLVGFFEESDGRLKGDEFL